MPPPLFPVLAIAAPVCRALSARVNPAQTDACADVKRSNLSVNAAVQLRSSASTFIVSLDYRTIR